MRNFFNNSHKIVSFAVLIFSYGLQKGLWCMLYCPVNIIFYSGNAARQTGWCSMYTPDRRSALWNI